MSRLLPAAFALALGSTIAVGCGTGGDNLFASGGAGPSSSNTGGSTATTSTSSGQANGGAGATASGGAGASGGGGATSTSSGAGEPICGNGVREPPEDCDGSDLGGHDCTELGFVAVGGLACAGCMLDPSGCHPTCGNGVIEPGETCDDGNVTGGDGCSASCQTEIGTTCATALPIQELHLGEHAGYSGSTTGGGSHSSSTCASAGTDNVFVVTVAEDGFLTASLPRPYTYFDSVLYASKTCDDAAPVDALTCNDSHSQPGNPALVGGEVISFPVHQGDVWFIFVDGGAAADGGDYQVYIRLDSGADCNDPVPIPLAPGSPMTLLGSNADNPNNTQGTCGGGPGNEVVYAITTPSVGGLKVATQNVDYNAVLYARSTCGNGTELACSNSGGNGANETITLATPTSGTSVTLYVDGSQLPTGPANGNYELVLTPP